MSRRFDAELFLEKPVRGRRGFGKCMLPKKLPPPVWLFERAGRSSEIGAEGAGEDDIAIGADGPRSGDAARL